MGWDRQPPHVVQAPEPLSPSRWLLAAVGAVLVSALLFLMHASARVPLLQTLNAWVLSGAPLLIWGLAFGARAYFYGSALSHYQFLEAEAQTAQQSWQDWAHRYLAVHASCVLLPDQVCASLLAQGAHTLPPRTGQARRISAVSAPEEDRARMGLQLLLPALKPALQALPAGQELRVTLLSDVDPGQYESLREVWQQSWTTLLSRPLPTALSLVAELSPQWIDNTLKSASTAVELLLVLQVQGGVMYSDGLAAMLLSPDGLARLLDLPVEGALSRAMPLEADALESELSLFLQTQTGALKAAGIVSDNADCQAPMGKVMAAAFAHNSSLSIQQRWVLETLCGLAGPLGHWLAAALAVEMVRHLREPLLILVADHSNRWISTVTAGERA